jgi:hypothetical protein
MSLGVLSEGKHFNAALARAEEGNLSPPFWRGPLAQLGRPLIRWYRARYLEDLGKLLDVQTGRRPRAASRATPERGMFATRLNSMAGLAGLERATDAGETFNSQLGLAELAVASRRFRLDHGHYPDALSALVPAYLTRVPLDPVTGTQFVYARHGAGFRLSAEQDKNVAPQMALALEWSVPK